MLVQVPYQAFTLQDLQEVVSFQLQKLHAYGAGARSPVAPQSMLAASEQHWNANGPQNGGFPLREQCVFTTHSCSIGRGQDILSNISCTVLNVEGQHISV